VAFIKRTLIDQFVAHLLYVAGDEGVDIQTRRDRTGVGLVSFKNETTNCATSPSTGEMLKGY
jgi:hypothetical protein